VSSGRRAPDSFIVPEGTVQAMLAIKPWFDGFVKPEVQ